MKEAKENLERASSTAETEEIRVRVLGKKGQLTEILRSMGSLGAEERKEFGKAANEVRTQIEEILEQKFAEMNEKQKAESFIKEKIDVTEPGVKISLGVKHPITITIDEISRVFISGVFPTRSIHFASVLNIIFSDMDLNIWVKEQIDNSKNGRNPHKNSYIKDDLNVQFESNRTGFSITATPR